MLDRAIDGLNPKPGGRYIDCTYGRGGHAEALLSRLDEAGRLLALDRDEVAVAHGRALAQRDARFKIVHAPFSELAEQAQAWGELGQVDGVLFDLGVSSPQVDEAERGFSFSRNGPLDMRMDRSAGSSAREWLATAEVGEIERVLRDYGEERFARRIARALVAARQQAEINSTAQLAELVAQALPAGARRERKVHPATLTFQAIRIEVNGELEQLREALPQARMVLKLGGRLAVISFHSLEDRMVKRALRERAGPILPRDLPVPASFEPQSLWGALGKAQRPDAEEVAANPRARSAVLRVGERLH